MLNQITATNDLKQSIAELLEPFGGMRRFVKPNETVLVKPNFNTADPPPASTDISFLKAVVELIYETGAKTVIVGESTTFYLNTRKTLEKTGVLRLENMNPAPVIYVFEEHDWVKKNITGAKYLKSVSVPEILDKVDKIITVPCLKTHKIGQFTGALKIAVGMMKPTERMKFHMGNVCEKIAELNKVYKPNLIIMDGRKCFVTEGPSCGIVKVPNILLASDNRIEIDRAGIEIIGKYEESDLYLKNPDDIVQIKYAREIGLEV